MVPYPCGRMYTPTNKTFGIREIGPNKLLEDTLQTARKRTPGGHKPKVFAKIARKDTLEMTKRQFYKALQKVAKTGNFTKLYYSSSVIHRYIDKSENVYCPVTLVCYSEKKVFVHCNLPYTAAKKLGLTEKDCRDIANAADGTWTKRKRTVKTLKRISETFNLA